MYGIIWIVKVGLPAYHVHAEENCCLMHLLYKGYSSFSPKYLDFLETPTKLRCYAHVVCAAHTRAVSVSKHMKHKIEYKIFSKCLLKLSILFNLFVIGV